jgi:hypothetical protein
MDNFIGIARLALMKQLNGHWFNEFYLHTYQFNIK